MTADTVRRIVGPTIKLASGAYFDLEDPDASDIRIEDIAHALSHICRYTGHCREFYSVAQHSVLVSSIVPPADQLAGLLHDAAEAFVGDVSKPLKILLPDYKAIEARVEASVFRRFGLPQTLPESVKAADRIALRTEQRDLMDAEGEDWTYTEGVAPLLARIHPQSSKLARDSFLSRFKFLTQRDRNG